MTPTQIRATDAATDYRSQYAEALPHVWRYLIRATAGDRHLAEDLTQEVFLRAHRAVVARPETLAIPWLMTVARNCFIDHVRKEARNERNLALAAANDAVDARESQSEPALTRAEAVAVLQALPPTQRAVLVLHHLDDLSVAEVAAALGKSVAATESLLARARAAFRSQIARVDDAD